MQISCMRDLEMSKNNLVKTSSKLKKIKEVLEKSKAKIGFQGACTFPSSKKLAN